MKVLLTRFGAYGDSIIITPVIRQLQKDGHEVIIHTSRRGMEVFKNMGCELIEYEDNSLPIEQIHKYMKDKAKEIGADKHINFTGSIEHNLAKHPNDPEYNYPKWERERICNKNYYEESFKLAGIEVSSNTNLNPSVIYDEDDIKKSKSYIKEDKFNILWAMSGSGRHKAYPWVEYVMGEILNKYKNIHFITVGDYRCKMIESYDKAITNLAGETSMMVSMCLTGLCDLVISPDTGVLHASGQYDTPKIGLLGHTTIENITKHFLNDYSLESDCACSPCFRLIYDHTWQCAVDDITGACWCMSSGISPERLVKQIEKVIPDEYRA